jgi:hypothetical protein
MDKNLDYSLGISHSAVAGILIGLIYGKETGGLQ